MHLLVLQWVGPGHQFPTRSFNSSRKFWTRTTFWPAFSPDGLNGLVVKRAYVCSRYEDTYASNLRVTCDAYDVDLGLILTPRTARWPIPSPARTPPFETTANLQHPNILPLFDSGEADSFLLQGIGFRDDRSRHGTQPGV